MTLEQFRYKHRDADPRHAVVNQLPDRKTWMTLRLIERMDPYISRDANKYLWKNHRSLMTDLHLAKHFHMFERAEELSARVRELSDGHLRFSAAKFFTEHCGWGWGGAALEKRDVEYVSGGYVLRDYDDPLRYPAVRTVRIPVAIMDVYRCGNRIRIPVFGTAAQSLDGSTVLPDAAADILLHPVLSDGELVGVMFAGYSDCGKETVFHGTDSFALLCYAIKNTALFLTGELYEEAETAYERELQRLAAKTKQARTNPSWDDIYRQPEPSDWDSTLETLDALGYDVDLYLDRTYYEYDY